MTLPDTTKLKNIRVTRADKLIELRVEDLLGSITTNKIYLHPSTAKSIGNWLIKNATHISDQSLNVSDVKRIKSNLKSGMTQRAIAEEFGVAQATIWAIATGKTWSKT